MRSAVWLAVAMSLTVSVRDGWAGDAGSVEAGPIWNQQDAEQKCPRVCGAGQWTGHWWTTVPNTMSVCQCASPSPPPPRRASPPPPPPLPPEMQSPQPRGWQGRHGGPNQQYVPPRRYESPSEGSPPPYAPRPRRMR